MLVKGPQLKKSRRREFESRIVEIYLQRMEKRKSH